MDGMLCFYKKYRCIGPVTKEIPTINILRSKCGDSHISLPCFYSAHRLLRHALSKAPKFIGVLYRFHGIRGSDNFDNLKLIGKYIASCAIKINHTSTKSTKIFEEI